MLNGHQFEEYCSFLLKEYGFTNLTVTKGSGDKGVDIIAYLNGKKFAIQCKCYSNKLGNSPIQEVVAGKNYYGCNAAIVLTNNYFTKSAIELAEANNVLLWDREVLRDILYKVDSQWKELLEHLIKF
ncbi:MAG: restriction endonuclease [Clostridia bacterium]|nr:restriction endonuclease [Clostridia bacterium]